MSDIIFPQNNADLVRGEYRLPITIVSPDEITDLDLTTLEAVKEFMPMTRFKEGDLVEPIDDRAHGGRQWGAWAFVRQGLLRRGLRIPRIWKVRHVLSTWSYELLALYNSGEPIHGVDHAHALMDAHGVRAPDFGRALIYAHGYPHAMYPNTASWFEPDVLRKKPVRDFNTVIWPEILDEAHTHFVSYAQHMPMCVDLAPDAYGLGQRLTRPFRHEEDAVHTAALYGLEEAMMVPVNTVQFRAPSRRAIDLIDDLDD